ncbi:MAG TPA: DinB family protein [Vicinamibacterales bacterium]|nr:DinB family protein [Vicinamibacterales bacterium]
MTNTQTVTSTIEGPRVGASARAEALARRLEQGIDAMIGFASTLTERQWNTPIPKDGRPVGVVVHHVASVFPIEIELAQQLARGQAITGVTWDDVHAMNAKHAQENAAVTRQEAIDLLRRNSASAAAAIRALTDEELEAGGTNSLYADAPLTCQHMLEDHAVRHSYHHLAKIKAAVKP